MTFLSPQRVFHSVGRSGLPACVVLCCLVLSHGQAQDSPAKSVAKDVDPEHAAKAAKGLELFKKQVRTILATKCLDCHGGAQSESGFSLATRDALLRGGVTGPAIVSGDPKKSWLYKLVTHAEKPHMPHEMDKLKPAEIAAIGQWIELGAPYDKPLTEQTEDPYAWTKTVLPESARDFWAFRPLKIISPPEVKNAGWCESPVDRFVLAAQEAAGVSPNTAASRRVLLRRAAFDVTGLPPSPELVDLFLNDNSPEAWERIIDQLLADPGFGERWGRHWLDLARFAESHGFEHDYDRQTAYHFRDFVIQALNDDLPFNAFVQWQLAGDEIAPDNRLALMATGFLAAGVHSTQITKNEVEKHRYDEMDDMLATTGTAMLGLTLGCARCHDHKFDPIPQRDYYQLLATFTTTVRSEVELDFDPAGYQRAKKAFDQAHAPLVAAREQFEKDELPARFARWEAARDRSAVAPWLVPHVKEATSSGGATLSVDETGVILATGKLPDQDAYVVTLSTSASPIRSIRLEALTHSSLVKSSPGRAKNGNFALTSLSLSAGREGKDAPAPAIISLTNPRATFEQQGLPVSAAIDDQPKSGWAVDPEFGKDHAAVFELAEPLEFEGTMRLTVTLKFENNVGHSLGRFRIAVSPHSNVDLHGEAQVEYIAQALAIAPSDRTSVQQAELLAWYRHRDEQWRQLDAKVQQHLGQQPQRDLKKVLISSEGVTPVRLHSQGEDFFPETFFLHRGETDQKAGTAAAAYLQVLMTPNANAGQWHITPPENSKLSYRRTALAHWLTDHEQGAGHLLARVIVNRLWQHLFGRGIVATPSDFGTRGEAPTHPELLDWLAGELIRNEWRLKPTLRLLLTSAAYRQGSTWNAASAAVDPDNRTFWRRPVARLEAEVIRDSLLAVGGTLDRSQFGPGTLAEASRRRSIYFTIKRSQLMPMLQVFDQPDALSGVGERPSTTIAPQALLLLNNAQIREAARAFAESLAKQQHAVQKAYRRALSRDPEEDELAAATAFVNSQTESYAASGNPQPEVAALADLCQTLMCLNEFLYVE